MAWFRRKSITEIPELKEFYENEKTERPLVAWTLALVSLLTTIIVVVGLFFGGRLLYRTIRKDNNQPVPAITEGEDDSLGEVDEDNEDNLQPAPTVSTEAATTTTPSVTTTSTALPNTGPSEPEL